MSSMTDQTRSRSSGIVTGECDHCRWTAAATSYPELVGMYQDHLREHHPSAWLRG